MTGRNHEKCRKTENRDRFESGGKKDLENQKMSIRTVFVLFLGMFSGKLYVVSDMLWLVFIDLDGM
jgi:hypothetical protein